MRREKLSFRTICLMMAFALIAGFAPVTVFGENIQPDAAYSGTITDEIKPDYYYYPNGLKIEEQMLNPYYNEYTFTADATGFYCVEWLNASNDSMQLHFIDSENISVPFHEDYNYDSAINDFKYGGYSYYYLTAGETYKTFVSSYEPPCDFSIVIKYHGTELYGDIEATIYNEDYEIVGIDSSRSLSWKLGSDGVLNISGQGDLVNNSKPNEWHDLRSMIFEIRMSEGITGTGEYQFEIQEYVEKVYIPNTVTIIADGTFAYCEKLSEIIFLGDAPVIEGYSEGDGEVYYENFAGVTATAYYPAGNPTWTADVMQDYGGSITWVAADTAAMAEQGATVTEDKISVTLNGSEIQFDQPPVMENDRVLVPIRAIFESLGYTLEWNQEAQTATAVNGDKMIKVTVGDTNITHEEGVYVCDVPPVNIEGRILVPVRAISESAHCIVDWNGETRTVLVTM